MGATARVIVEPRPEARPLASDGERGLTLRQVCDRLGIAERTYYRREAIGYWRRHGLIEIPRPDGHTRGSKRLFAASSLDRLIAGGGRVRRA